jgi:hypothetical protein
VSEKYEKNGSEPTFVWFDEIAIWRHTPMGYPSYDGQGIPPVPPARDAIAQAQRDVERLSDWIDGSPANRRRDPEARTWGRLAKIQEEAGEVISAYIAATGQNPRKPKRPEAIDEVAKELLDVALTALAAYEHLVGSGTAMTNLLNHITATHHRALGLNPSEVTMVAELVTNANEQEDETTAETALAKAVLAKRMAQAADAMKSDVGETDVLARGAINQFVPASESAETLEALRWAGRKADVPLRGRPVKDNPQA